MLISKATTEREMGVTEKRGKKANQKRGRQEKKQQQQQNWNERKPLNLRKENADEDMESPDKAMKKWKSTTHVAPIELVLSESNLSELDEEWKDEKGNESDTNSNDDNDNDTSNGNGNGMAT
ncbi:hypothetical protein RFI_22956, partial [Reticulomyxa filosa]